MSKNIPYAQIDTLFLDAGNTLVSMDFDWIAAEIQARGFACDPQMVRRAEAASRPTVSEVFVNRRTGATASGFPFYLVLPGVPDALDAFRSMGLRLVVVSNSDGTAERSLVETGLREYFAVVVDSTLVGFSKPDPRIFLHALTESGAHPSQVAHVGDLYHADVVGARRAGLYAVLLDPFDDWDEVDCECVPDLGALADRFRASRNTHPPI